MNYLFAKELISQNVVKFGVDVRPTITLDTEKTRLTDYCNWLIEHFPAVFETLLIGPKQLRVQRTFPLANNKRIEMPTFGLTARGPIFTFPRRLYIDQVHDIDIPTTDEIFRKALHQLRIEFPDRAILRVNVTNQFVFDTGQTNSLDILTSILKYDVWRQRINNLAIHLETRRQNKNINIDIRPTYLRRISKAGPAPLETTRFGIMVNVDISNSPAREDLTTTQIHHIIAFAQHYISDELIKFLNNEG